MNLEGIINISGKPGLYRIISQGKNSIIVESLIDKKRIPLYSRNQANSLEEIGIYTYEDTLPLVDVFKKIAIKENCKQCILVKSSQNALENYFREMLSDYDEDRVYISDMKKIINWYNTLQSAGLIQLPKEKEKTQKEKKEK